METVFWARFTQLCKDNSTSPSAVVKKIGLSSGSPTAWKRGTTPETTTVKKIADFFGVEVEDLIGVKTKKAPDVAKDTEGGIDMDSVQFALYDGAKDLTPEQIEEVLGFVRYVRSRDEYRKAKENRSDGNDNGGTV